MRKIIVGVATVAVVGLGSVFFNDTTVLANTSDGITSERATIKKKLSKADAKIADVLIDLKELNEEIAQVDETLEANQKAMKETKEEISVTKEEVEKLEIEIAELEEKIEARYEILKQRIASYQTTGGEINYLEVLLGAKDFSEFISRVSAVAKITNSDTELMEQQQADKEKVEKQQEKVEKKLSDLNDMKLELESLEELIIEQKKENEQKKKKLENKKKELNTLKDELKIKDSTLAALEEEVKSSLNAGLTVSSDTKATASKGGKLGWPTAGGYISSHMGSRWGRAHNGIDIARTDRSTSPPIFAADSGVIESAGSSNGYGNKVVINHGNGMKTVYAHLASISVSSGQSVSKGSAIGIMGTTGNSTGIHLHFEVYENGALQNPTKYFN